MNENCIKDEKLVIKFAPWMKKNLNLQNEWKVGEKNCTMDENWKLKLWHDMDEKLKSWTCTKNEKMWLLIYPGRTFSINPFTSTLNPFTYKKFVVLKGRNHDWKHEKFVVSNINITLNSYCVSNFSSNSFVNLALCKKLNCLLTPTNFKTTS